MIELLMEIFLHLLPIYMPTGARNDLFSPDFLLNNSKFHIPAKSFEWGKTSSMIVSNE